MPCTDGLPYERINLERVNARIKILEAYLCATMKYLEKNACINDFLATTNWKEVGTTQIKLERWWTKHKQKDEQRRIRESKKKEQDKLRKRAIAKLSVEERKVLGL